MRGRHLVFEDLAFVVGWLHFLAVNKVCKVVCSTARIFCVVCALHAQNRILCKLKKNKVNH